MLMISIVIVIIKIIVIVVASLVLPFWNDTLSSLIVTSALAIAIGDVTSRCRWLFIVITYYYTIIRACNYDHVIVIVINARWRARRIEIVLHSMMIGRDGEADELCYVMYMFYSLLLAILWLQFAQKWIWRSAWQNEDKGWRYWIVVKSIHSSYQHDCLSPIFISFSGIIEIRLLNARIVHTWHKRNV